MRLRSGGCGRVWRSGREVQALTLCVKSLVLQRQRATGARRCGYALDYCWLARAQRKHLSPRAYPSFPASPERVAGLLPAEMIVPSPPAPTASSQRALATRRIVGRTHERARRFTLPTLPAPLSRTLLCANPVLDEPSTAAQGAEPRRSPPEVSDVRDRPASELRCNTPQATGRHSPLRPRGLGDDRRSRRPDGFLEWGRFRGPVSAGRILDRIAWRFASGPCDTWLARERRRQWM